MSSAADPVYFFIHVMKSGGTTFTSHLEANVPVERCYPDAPRGPARRRQYTLVDELVAHAAVHGGSTRAYSGHFPYIASELVPADVRLTILRDPVERTVSALRHFKEHDRRYAELPLEAIYEDPWVFPMHLRDYQVKQFAMVGTDKLESHMDVLEVDDRRLAVALEHLERVDVLGLTTHYDEFLQRLADRFGWRIRPVPRMRVSDTSAHLPSGFERRIRADNTADIAFYERAADLWARRRRARAV